jgi:peptide/nickel transport system ATP-binding protein
MTEARVDSPVLLRARGLGVVADGGGEARPLVTDVDLELEAGEILGVVGESGCGKSTLCRAIARTLPRGLSVSGGSVTVAGRDWLAGSSRAAHRVHPGGVGMVFQNPRDSLNPVMRVGDQVIEAIRVRSGGSRGEARDAAVALLERLGIEDARRRMDDLPHQFSGGQCQRLVIAVALAGEPAVLIADEATSALDVTTQAQILELLREVTRERGIGMLFVSHNYAVVAQMCRRVAVMYAGRVVEGGPTAQLLSEPAHPYTSALLQALPDIDQRASRLAVIPGVAAAPGRGPAGCPFSDRCPYAEERCVAVVPELRERAPGRSSACLRVAELELPTAVPR